MDVVKRRLCNEKEIRLITVHDSYDELEPPFDADCFVYGFDLGGEEDHESFKELAETICVIAEGWGHLYEYP